MTALGISVKELSRKTGIELQTLYSILNGHHQPSLQKLEMICSELQISLDTLLDLEVNTFFMHEQKHKESLIYAKFEEIWFGPTGGERISVSRNLSIANYPDELREEFLRKIYCFTDDQIEQSMDAFRQRQKVIAEKEKRRLEIVTVRELQDFILQREPYHLLDREMIFSVIESVIKRLEEKPLDYELIVIPRQHLQVNYEIINREVVLFDLGSIYLRQTHESIISHFINEVENFKFKLARYSSRDEVIQFLVNNMKKSKTKS